MQKKVIVIGGGIAGMTAAKALSESGFGVTLIERQATTGGHVKQWDKLFPSFRPGSEVMNYLSGGLGEAVDVRCNSRITAISRQQNEFLVSVENNAPLAGDAIVVATGFDLFEAQKKEEYGYGLFGNVVTSADLESLFSEGKRIATAGGKSPTRIGLVHCVGSRDEKAGHRYCSKVCCVTGVKQAIELRKMMPSCEVFSFYMDLRMYDRNFEELYFEAQQKWGVNFIRGRVSECAETADHSIVLKTEDTLTGRPLKLTVDLLVLLVGFTPSGGTAEIARMTGLESGEDGFLLTEDEHIRNNSSRIQGIFLTGAVKGPACIADTIADARSTALQVQQYLNLSEKG
jgi:heterodisulfide reductase subunit A